MKIILSGGGTAGHVIPLLEVARELKKRGHKVIYVGAGYPERKLVKTVKYKEILAGKWRRYFSFSNLIDPFKTAIGWLQSIMILRRLKPDAVLVKGGYVSLPIILAVRLLKIHLYAHESDSIMGLANRLAYRFAKKVFVGFPVDQYPFAAQSKLIYSGIPVRRPQPHASIKQFDFSKKLPIVLVTGGSQGAHGINKLVFFGLKDILQSYQLIHLTGPYDFKRAIEARNRLPFHLKERYAVYRFLDDDFMDAIKIAGVVVSRGGASSLAEIVSVRKVGVIIPLPSAASDHQSANAEWYHKRCGFVILEQEGATSSDLLRAIVKAFEQKPTALNTPQAALLIAKTIHENEKS